METWLVQVGRFLYEEAGLLVGEVDFPFEEWYERGAQPAWVAQKCLPWAVELAVAA